MIVIWCIPSSEITNCYFKSISSKNKIIKIIKIKNNKIKNNKIKNKKMKNNF
jgi:hypothetical protein